MPSDRKVGVILRREEEETRSPVPYLVFFPLARCPTWPVWRIQNRRSANLFFQLVTRRYERGSMLLTTNQMVTQWGQVFGDEMIAAAVLDRLLHHSHVLVVQGESYRLKQKKRAGLVARSAE